LSQRGASCETMPVIPDNAESVVPPAYESITRARLTEPCTTLKIRCMSGLLADRVLQRARIEVQRLRASRTARQVRAHNLTYLSPTKLRNIEWALVEIKRNGVPGAFIETGVALGGSGILIAKHLEPGRTFHGYDVFEMIPPPTETDPPKVHERSHVITSGASKGLGGDVYYGYQDGLYERVLTSFRSFNVAVDSKNVYLHKGLFEDTLYPNGPIALAHIDCDWYEPVKLSLERIFPHLQSGGFVISDDYFDYGGATQAVDEFRNEHREELEIVPDRGREHIIMRRI
jgi:O-methyltransferase